MSSEAAVDAHGETTFGRALSWSYLLSVGKILVTLGVSLVLARLLGPEAFGLIAMANVYVLFVDMIAGRALTTALVQRKALSGSDLNTAFWLIVGAVSVLVPASLALSSLWADMNNTPGLQPVIIGLTPIILLRGLSAVPEALLIRKMHFRTLAIRTNVSVLVGGGVGLWIALTGGGVWALVGQQLAGGVMELIAVWMASAWRPRPRFSRNSAKGLLSFSARTTLGDFGVFVTQRSDALLIGLLFGPLIVGLYRMAARLVETALEFAVGGLQSISLPELSRLHARPEEFRLRTVELMRMASVIATPIFGILAATSGTLFALLGDEWSSAAAPLTVLCILAVFQVGANLIGPALQAGGRPGLHAALTWIGGFLSAASFLLAGYLIRGGDEAEYVLTLAVARAVTFIGMILLLVVPLVHRALEIPPRMLVSAMGGSILGVAPGAGVCWLVFSHVGWPFDVPVVVRLAVQLFIASVLCLGGLLVAEPYARERAGALVRRLRSRTGARAAEASARPRGEHQPPRQTD